MEPKWLELARAELGQHEIAGEHDSPAIMAYYKDAGHPTIAHESTPWCAAFACAVIERAGYASPKTLSARDFLRWGKTLDKPKPGCICVFSRGDPRAYTGHVGFYVGEEDGNILLLGGNQSDSVSITRMPKSRLLKNGYRWPVTGTNSRTTKAVVVAAASAVTTGATGVVQVVTSSPEQVAKIGAEMKGMGIPWLTITGSLLVMLSLAIVAYAHWSDLKKNGK